MPPKSRNFDGCWTCRSRKVKCDLKKPYCDRCKKAQLQCAGYKIILGWSTPMTISSQDNSLSYLTLDESIKQDNFQRRNIDLVKFADNMYYPTYSELNNKIETLEYKAEGLIDQTIIVGPFSVYRLNGTPSSSSAISNNLNEDTVRLGSPLDSIHKNYKDQSYQVQNDHTHNDKVTQKKIKSHSNINAIPGVKSSMVHSELLEYAKLTVLAIKGIDYKFNEQNMLHILYPKFFPNIDSDNWIANIKIIDRMLAMDNTDIKLKPLFKTLLNNFSSEVFTFLRVYYKHNYMENIIIPYIMQIVFEFICHNISCWKMFKFEEDQEVTLVEIKEHIKLAIIYSYLGLSAFKMSAHYSGSNTTPIGNDGTDLDEYLQISIDLRKISITIINYHLDEYDSNSLLSDENDFEYDNLLLLALILQIQLDSFFSVFENFELIFAIGDFVIKNKYRGKYLSDFSILLVEIFEYINIVFESTHSVNDFNYSIDELEQKTLYKDLNENYDVTKNAENDSDVVESDVSRLNEESEGEIDKNESDEDVSEENGVLSKTFSRAGSVDYQPVSFTLNFGTNSERNDKIQGPAGQLPHKWKRVQEIHIPRIQNNLSLEENAISLQFGLPKAFLKLFYEVIRLTNDKRIFQRKKQFPRNFPKICSEVEERLINWNINDHWKLYNTSYNLVSNKQENNFISDFHLCLFHYIKSFHLAVISYFCRIIKGVSILDPTFQSYIKESLTSFELVMNTKLDTCKFRPLFWVLIISGSNVLDLELQQKVRQLSNNYILGQPNYWRAKQIIFEVWKRREIGEDSSWLDLVREWDIVLCLS